MCCHNIRIVQKESYTRLMHPCHVVGRTQVINPLLKLKLCLCLVCPVHDDVVSLEFIEGPILVDVSTVYTLHFSVNSSARELNLTWLVFCTWCLSP